MAEVRLEVEGLRGGHDARRLTRGLAELGCVVSILVDPGAGTAELEVDVPLAEAMNDLREVVEGLGYRLVGVDVR